MPMPSCRELANALRFLSMDAVQKANSGHPGMPMGMADIAQILFGQVLNHNPQDPSWLNRDRFVLSNGHGSMLLYSALYLTGYDLAISDLKNFRQLHSKTPGHPELGYTPGVETTTGPLGQGLANAVGMAIAERSLAKIFNKPNFEIINHFTYAFCGDGCLMEGISHEACSLAGTLGLGKLIIFWDDNGISIDGNTQGWFTDDTAKRFESYGWQVIRNVDGHDPKDIKQAISLARDNYSQPTLICCKTIIGYGAPNKQGTAATHGAPLGDEEIKQVREKLNWPYGPFEIPEEIKQAWDQKTKGQELQKDWQDLFNLYQKNYPELAAELIRRTRQELPLDWKEFADHLILSTQKEGKNLASRQASQVALEKLMGKLPELLGGSADLTGSNLTKTSLSKVLTLDNPAGNYIFYGVREFGMSAIMNGLSVYKGLIPYGGTFLVFSDYSRNAIRMAAIMKQRVIHVLTHDSIGLGEDGPTHQPIEHLASLRIIPNVSVWRPCDDVETMAAWRYAIEKTNGPTCLALSRQTLPHQERSESTVLNISKGGYVLKAGQNLNQKSNQKPDLILLATGSEIALAIESAKKLEQDNNYSISIQVVSMPCVELFERQDPAYKNQVLPKDIPTISIEAGSPDTWYRYVNNTGNNTGHIIAIHGFGESAPAPELFKHFGFSIENICAQAQRLLGKF